MQIVTNGLLLMLIGMGTVFVFLSIMVVATEGTSRLAARYAHLLPEIEKPKPRKPSRVPAETEEDGALFAVIAAAIHRYRSEHPGM